MPRPLVRDLVINGALAWGGFPRRLRPHALRRLGMDVETDLTVISPRCFFGGTDIAIGRGCFINYEVFFDNQAKITIGDQVAIGPRTQLLTSVHEEGPAKRRAGAVFGKPVTIGDGCWLGASVMVLPGVTIGAGCIVAAGAVVVADCEPNGVYAGVPARRVRDLPSA